MLAKYQRANTFFQIHQLPLTKKRVTTWMIPSTLLTAINPGSQASRAPRLIIPFRLGILMELSSPAGGGHSK